MQAGVPLVPVVIHNAGDLMWRNSLLVRPGRVHVTVLPPISTKGWSARQLGTRVAQVEQLFRDTLHTGAPAGGNGLAPREASRPARRPKTAAQVR